MEDERFATTVRAYLQSSPDLMTTITAGTTLCSVTPVRLHDWVPGYVSPAAGRWNFAGRPAKYFGSSLSLCLAELAGCEAEILHGVCEDWRAEHAFPALDVGKLPDDLLRELYLEGNDSGRKWRKSHLFLGELENLWGASATAVIKAPSAYGCALKIPGYTLALNPRELPLVMMHKCSLAR